MMCKLALAAVFAAVAAVTAQAEYGPGKCMQDYLNAEAKPDTFDACTELSAFGICLAKATTADGFENAATVIFEKAQVEHKAADCEIEIDPSMEVVDRQLRVTTQEDVVFQRFRRDEVGIFELKDLIGKQGSALGALDTELNDEVDSLAGDVQALNRSVDASIEKLEADVGSLLTNATATLQGEVKLALAIQDSKATTYATKEEIRTAATSSSSVFIFSVALPECEATGGVTADDKKVCSSNRATQAFLYGKGLAAGVDGLYKCVLELDDGTKFEGPGATVKNLGEGRQEVSCILPAVKQPGDEVKFTASLFLREAGVYYAPSAAWNPIIVFDNVPPVFGDMIGPCKPAPHGSGKPRPKSSCGDINSANVKGSNSNLFPDAQTIEVFIDYDDYYDGFDKVKMKIETLSKDALPDESGTFSLNIDKRTLRLKFDIGWMKDFVEGKDKTAEASFKMTATDTHKKSASKAYTITLIKPAKPTCVNSCKELKAIFESDYDSKGVLNPDLTAKEHPTGSYKTCDTNLDIYCEMTLDGGGWTLVANINPADGGTVGYNNQPFWTGDAAYGGGWSRKFSHDYKTTQAQNVKGEIMTVSTTPEDKHLHESGVVKGYRIWDFSNTWDSLFTTTTTECYYCSSKGCATGASKKVFKGSSSTCDDIIHQGGCLHANRIYGSSVDMMRLTTIPYNGRVDNNMAGFGSCIDCLHHQSPRWMGIDRAACCTGHCAYHQVRGVGTQGSYDCRGSNNYCNGNYPQGKFVGLWTSRFFIREQ